MTDTHNAENAAAGDDRSSDKSEGPTDTAGMDQVPQAPAAEYDDSDQNAPLPDWGPTDGTHGVDGSDPSE